MGVMIANESVSNCCRAEINYGLGKIGGLIRCKKCGYICNATTNTPLRKACAKQKVDSCVVIKYSKYLGLYIEV